MPEQAELSATEWELIIALLEREESELPSEIHHTRSSSVRDQLRERQEVVRSLLDRLRVKAIPLVQHNPMFTIPKCKEVA